MEKRKGTTNLLLCYDFQVQYGSSRTAHPFNVSIQVIRNINIDSAKHLQAY